MKKATVGRTKYSRERGDTIVEVLLSLAVLGAVLGAAYVVSNRNIITNRVSQERLEAVKLAETQFERLKIQASNNATVLDQSGFCLPKGTTPGNEVVDASDSRCHVNTNGDPVTADVSPRYSMAIVRDAYVSVPNIPQAGTRFRITMTWDNVAGDGTDRLDSFYEVYR